MPEAKWVPLGFLQHKKPGPGSLATPVLTLDDIEAWLKGCRIENDYEEGFRDDMLAQVQAMRDGN